MSEALVGRTLERSRSPGRNPPSSAGLREGRHPVEMGAGYTGGKGETRGVRARPEQDLVVMVSVLPPTQHL